MDEGSLFRSTAIYDFLDEEGSRQDLIALLNRVEGAYTEDDKQWWLDQFDADQKAQKGVN
jgi:hypothetical protein